MRHTFDMTPFTRSSVGFERLLHQLDAISQPEPDDNLPPYNIEQAAENRYRIALAVAGYGDDDLSIIVEGNVLTVAGKPSNGKKPEGMLYHGISRSSFVRRFSLAEHVVVKDAQLSHGLLVIDLERQIPEAMKPHRIIIGSGKSETLNSRNAA